ncbi:MAG: hypothetical protein WBN61_13280 [Woeseiaceae bacterium]
MTRHIVHILALFWLVVFGAQLALAECECPPESVEKAIRKADRIFRAEVISAQISEEDPQTIEFVVQVDEGIRGHTTPQYQLTTSLPGSCGVSIRLGFHDVYVLGPGETNVSSCKGSGRAVYMTNPSLAVAIALVDLPVSDSRGAQRLLSKHFYQSYNRATVDEFFILVEKIDSTGNTAIGYKDRIEYRGIAVHFKDGTYEKVEEL